MSRRVARVLEPDEQVQAIVIGAEDTDVQARTLPAQIDEAMARIVVVTQRNVYVLRSTRIGLTLSIAVLAKHPLGSVAVRVTNLPRWEPLLWVGDFRLIIDRLTRSEALRVADLANA